MAPSLVHDPISLVAVGEHADRIALDSVPPSEMLLRYSPTVMSAPDALMPNMLKFG